MKNFLKILAAAILFLSGFFVLQNAAAYSDRATVDVNLQVTMEASCNNNDLCEPGLGETIVSCPNDCASCNSHGDINKDGHINIVDFSIMMFYWGQTDPANPCVDLNHDHLVDITDFSIMLYWWTG